MKQNLKFFLGLVYMIKDDFAPDSGVEESEE